jgi:hypothetical protein
VRIGRLAVDRQFRGPGARALGCSWMPPAG